MRKVYGKIVCCVVGICLITSCSKDVDVAYEKEICKGQEECTQLGDEILQTVNKKMEGLSELEEPADYIEDPEVIQEAEEQLANEENYFFLASYYIENEELTDPYSEELDKKRLNKVFAEDKEAKNEIIAQHEDIEYHEMLWEIYRTLIPATYRESIKEFDIVTDGYDGMAAHVSPSIDRPKEWILSLDMLDSNVNIEQVMKTLIHETAHVLTLQDTQVPVDTKYLQAVAEEKDITPYQEKCDTLFLLEGCAKRDSYINQFHSLFWRNMESEWQEKQVETSLEAQIQFFKEKHDQFVSEYATTNVAEDIAETFTAFILQDSKKVKESQEIKYQKIAFFYQFPELVKMRAEVLSGLYEISSNIE